MIKRLYRIAQANLSDFILRKTGGTKPAYDFVEEKGPNPPVDINPIPDSLTDYYANLELPPGASHQEVKRAWKQLMKKYHPDLHSTDPKKREIANELTRRLNEAYRVLDKELAVNK